MHLTPSIAGPAHALLARLSRAARRGGRRTRESSSSRPGEGGQEASGELPQTPIGGLGGNGQGEVAKRRVLQVEGKRTSGLLASAMGVLAFLLFFGDRLLHDHHRGLADLRPAPAPWQALALVLAVIAGSKDISDEAIEIKAKLEALRRWLKDFTRLEEAVPRDVVLWNRLLVMAVVLGVADEVIKQLKMAVPEVLERPRHHADLRLVLRRSRRQALRAASTSYAAAHHVSSAALAASSSSSGGGGGGGFSGGGGGGFGGGGGGGAF